MDLFSRKVISWNISSKPDVNLVMTAFKKLMRNIIIPKDLYFILTGVHNTKPFHFGSYWILLILCSHFQRKVILSIIPAVKISSNISKRKNSSGIRCNTSFQKDFSNIYVYTWLWFKLAYILNLTYSSILLFNVLLKLLTTDKITFISYSEQPFSSSISTFCISKFSETSG